MFFFFFMNKLLFQNDKKGLDMLFEIYLYETFRNFLVLGYKSVYSSQDLISKHCMRSLIFCCNSGKFMRKVEQKKTRKFRKNIYGILKVLAKIKHKFRQLNVKKINLFYNGKVTRGIKKYFKILGKAFLIKKVFISASTPHNGCRKPKIRRL